MNSKLRRIAAGLLVPVVLVWSVLAPRQAYAFFPVAVIGVPVITGVGGGTYALAGLAGLIGLTGLMLTLEDLAGNKANIPLGPNPQNQPKPLKQTQMRKPPWLIVAVGMCWKVGSPIT